jgi:hypothetical protein
MTKYRDIITGISAILISIFIYILTFFVRDFGAVSIGPDFVPRIVSILFGILGIIILFQGIHALRTGPEVQPSSVKKANKHGVIKSFLLLCGYISLLDTIGFIIMTTVYLFFQMTLLSPVRQRRYALFAFVALFTSISTYYLFVGFFQVMIPAGILG